MLFEPVVGVALAAWLLDEALAPDPGRSAASRSSAAALLLQRSARPAASAAADDAAGPVIVPGRPVAGYGAPTHARRRRSASSSSTTTRWSAAGMRDFLDLHDDLEVVGEAADGAEAVERAPALEPDVVVMDL